MVPKLAFLAALALPAAASAAAPGYEPGNWWEQTVEFQMPGMAMPPQTSRECISKKGWEQPPKQGEMGENCRMKDLKKTATRMTFRLECDDGVAGNAEMTFTGTTFASTMTMKRQGQNFVVRAKGKKVGGDCDANESERRAQEIREQAEGQQAMVAGAQAQGCADGIEEMQIELFAPPPGMPQLCADKVPAFCKRLETREGFVAFGRSSSQEGSGARERAERLCKRRLADVEKRLCAEAGAEQARGRKLEGDAVEFVFGSCPEQAKVLARTECGGRSYTSMSEAQREFCTKNARRSLDQGEPAPSRGPSDVESLQRLRGILGR